MSESTDEMSKIKERFPSTYITNFEDKYFEDNVQKIKERFEILDNKGNKVSDLDERLLAVSAINALTEYLTQTQMTSLEHINKINIYR